MRKIELIGTVSPYGTIHYENGTNEFLLIINRSSGNTDEIIVCTKEDVPQGDVHIVGDVRSQRRENLEVYVVAESMEPVRGQAHMNRCELSGEICSRVNYRVTPKGRVVSNVTMAATKDDRYCFVPIIFWGKNAAQSIEYRKHDFLTVEGRLQSRDYIKNGIKKTTYEVSVSKVELDKKGGQI